MGKMEVKGASDFMATNVSSAMDFEWPSDVLALAGEHGLENALPKLLEMTRTVFPSANKVDVFVEDDAEIPNYRSLVFKVIAKLSVGEAVEARRTWTRQLLERYPIPRSCPIVLSLDLAE